MRVLIVESRQVLARRWSEALAAEGCPALIVSDQAGAVAALHIEDFRLMLLDLVLDAGAALAVADYAAYRRPEMPVLFVSSSAAFADGSIFNHCANACAFMPATTPPADLAALALYHARPPFAARAVA